MSETPLMETEVEAVKQQPEPEKSVEMQVVDSMCDQIENGADEEQQVTTASEGGDDNELVVEDEVGEDEPVEMKEEVKSLDSETKVIESTTESEKNVENGTTTVKTGERLVEAPKIRNIRKIARVPKKVLEYMMKFNEDDTVTINVTQLKVWVQGEMFKAATAMMACDWKTTEVPLMECAIPDSAVDNFDVIVNFFHKDSVGNEDDRIAREMERHNNPHIQLNKQKRRAATKAAKKAAREGKRRVLAATASAAPIKVVNAAESVPAKILPAVPEKVSGANNRAQEKAAVKRPNQPAPGETNKPNAPFTKKQKTVDNRPQRAPVQPNKSKQTFPNKNQNRNNQNQKSVQQNRMPDRVIRDQYHSHSSHVHRDLPRNEIWTSPVQPQMSSFNTQSFTPSQSTQYSTITNQMNGSWSSPWQSSPLVMDSTSNIQPVPPPVPRAQVELTSTALSSLLNRITSNMITGNNNGALQLSQQMKNERDLTQYIEPLDNLGIGSFSNQSNIGNSIGSFHYNGFTSVSEPVNPMHYNLGHNGSSSAGLPYSDFISPNTFAMTGSVRRDDRDNSGQRRNNHHDKPNNSRHRQRSRYHGTKSHGGSK